MLDHIRFYSYPEYCNHNYSIIQHQMQYYKILFLLLLSELNFYQNLPIKEIF